MLPPLTPPARRALQRARRAAEQHGQQALSPDHILAGLLEESDGTACETLRLLGFDPAEMRTRLEHSFPAGPPAAADLLPFDGAARRVLDAAHVEMSRTHALSVETGHLLLGLLAGAEGTSAALLAPLRGRLEEVRRAVAGNDEWDTLMAHARRAAERFGHELLEAEHLLLGLIEWGPARDLLRRLGAHPAAIAGALEARMAPGPGTPAGQLPFSFSAKRVLEQALEAAGSAGGREIAAAHLLLALLREGGAPGAALRSAGVAEERLLNRA